MPTTYRVIVLPTAYADLDRITSYIEQDSPQNAAETLGRLWRATQSLAMFPQRYKVQDFPSPGNPGEGRVRVCRASVAFPKRIPVE